MKKSKYGNADIATELDTFIRTSVVNGIPTKDWLKSTKTELNDVFKIDTLHFISSTGLYFFSFTFNFKTYS